MRRKTDDSIINNNNHCLITGCRHLVQTQVPSDVDSEDAMVLVTILQTHLHTRFRLARTYDNFWNDMIRCCDPIDGRITQLSLVGFDNNCRTPIGVYPTTTRNTKDGAGAGESTLLSKLEKLERLDLRNCRSLPVADFPAMKSLKWLNLCILDTIHHHNNGTNFLLPKNRDWYPPNLKTFLIYGYKVKGDPLDALIATSIVMRLPPIELDDEDIIPPSSADSSSNANHDCFENDIQDVLLSDGIGPFVKYDERSGRVSELRLSSVVPNTFLQRSLGLALPRTIGRLEMLKKLFLYNVCSVPKELANLVHLRVLRLDGCSTFSDYPLGVRLPTVLDLQLRTCANESVLQWITSCFPSLRSLEILNVDPNSLENVFQTLGENNNNRRWDGNDSGGGSSPPICFRNSLVKLHVSANRPYTPVPGLETFFGILDNHPKMSKLYVERVLGGGSMPGWRFSRSHLESLMATILEHYPRVRGLSIGGPNIFTFDNRQRTPRRLGNGSPASTASRPLRKAMCDVLLNLNRCGRVLLNQATTPVVVASMGNTGNSNSNIVDGGRPTYRDKETSAAPVGRWIPASLWPRVLERAQAISYSGTVRSKKDRRAQETSALYFLLRNGPALALREQFGFEFVTGIVSKKDGDGDCGTTANSRVGARTAANRARGSTTRKRKHR